MFPSSNWLGHHSFTVKIRDRDPMGMPNYSGLEKWYLIGLIIRRSQDRSLHPQPVYLLCRKTTLKISEFQC